MKTEKHYEFRKRLAQVHKQNIRDHQLTAASDELVLSDGCRIVISPAASEVTVTAAKDFVDYLFTSMNISAMLCTAPLTADVLYPAEPGTDASVHVFVGTEAEMEASFTLPARQGYRIETTQNVIVCGFDDRSTAQGLYQLEDLMSIRRAPFLTKKSIERQLRFSPRMVHSGYGLDEFPEEHLASIAHAGRDAILVFTKETDLTPYGYLDFNDLIRRAARYGIDVYAYSYLKITMHPDEPGAAEAYDALYGTLFKNCPGLRGIVMVGESVEFASKDEHVGKCGRAPADALPTGKPRPGWWPCYDYPQWLNLVKNTVRKYQPDADIVFWTYNWGWVEEKYRIQLIDSLPTDISLLVTFEMFEQYEKGSITEYCSDYTIVFEGPGKYFASEAKAAARRGIRLYSMANTGGMTWDMGVLPYIPVPQQWIKRYRNMIAANEDWGLCGLMESHHYGFYPSFIGDLSGRVFDLGADSPEEELHKALCKHYGAAHADVLQEALSYWSEAITHFTPSNEDQYGPLRVGPAYPFLLNRHVDVPCAKYAMFGSRICYTEYPGFPTNDRPKNTAMPLRVPREIGFLEQARDLFRSGLNLMKALQNPNEELLRLINMGEFIVCIITTTLHIKKWYLAKCALQTVTAEAQANELLDQLEVIAHAEIDNAEQAIPLVEYDSRLGWEPSMEYVCHRENIEFKLRHLQYVLDKEIPSLRESYRCIQI